MGSTTTAIDEEQQQQVKVGSSTTTEEQAGEGWIDVTSNGNSNEHVEKESSLDLEDRDPTMHSITFSTPSSWPNSICWSLDDRIAVLTDSCIYVLKISTSNKRKKHGSPLGMQLEHYYIEQMKSKQYDEGVYNKLKAFSKSTKLDVKQKVLFDRALVWRTELLAQNDTYCDVKWSPLGCASDGRCVLATLAASGIVRIHSSAQTTGIWYECIDITAALCEYVTSKNYFLENEVKGEGEEKDADAPPPSDPLKDLKDITWCRYLLFSTVTCWGTMLWHCHSCLSNILSDNIYYTSYFVNYAKCKHSMSAFITASKNGYIFVWLVTFNMGDETAHKTKALLHWSTGQQNPTSVAWHQVNVNEAFVAVGFTNGIIKVYRLAIAITLEGKYLCNLVQTVEVWNEDDMISVLFLNWILPMDSVLRLVCAKSTDIVIITFQKDENGSLVCFSCEVGPSCHASPITSLQCISHKYVLSSSRASTQYFDIENERLHLCENNVLRGFKCFGVTSAPNMTMLARVCCPNRLLLQQNSFVKQMEVSFLPFLSTDFIAERLVDESIHLDICVREYISICSADQFILPQILHKHCDEPASYELSLHELQMYLYFNQLRFMQQSGMRVCPLTREEVDADLMSGDFDDFVISRIERAIAVHFFREMLSKCLQLLENGWVKETDGGVLALLLMADWLCQIDMSEDAFVLPQKCYSSLHETVSLDALTEFRERLLIEEQEKNDNKNNIKKIKTESESCDESKEVDVENDTSNDASMMEDDQPLSTIAIKKEENHQASTTAPSIEKFTNRKWNIAREKCPFCDVDVSLLSMKTPKCINGHEHLRCCLTLRISMKDKYRQCVGCGRKASHKCFAGELNIDSVLLNIDLCPFCGCRFIDYYNK